MKLLAKIVFSALGIGLFSINIFAQPVGSKNIYSGEANRDFEALCGSCHFPGGYGFFSLQRRLGPDMAVLHERENLSAEFIRLAVRKGYLAMPRFTRVEVTDHELDGIIDFLMRPKNKEANHVDEAQ